MKITNRFDLPEPLYKATSQVRRPDPERLSVTTLIGPPQIRILQLRHWDELVEDSSERIWATMGTLMHTLLEGHAGENHQAERTLETIVEGLTVTGTFDLHTLKGVVSDYKFVSIWTVMDGIKSEWIEQLNCYAELLRRAGHYVERLQIVAIFRDWSKGKANDPSYPQSQVRIYEIPLWTPEQATEFLTARVRLHAAAQFGDVPECTPEERWARPTKYALMKRGNKKALRVFDDIAEAEKERKKEDQYVQTRPGASVRCESYCSVAAFCPQFAKLKEEQQES